MNIGFKVDTDHMRMIVHVTARDMDVPGSKKVSMSFTEELMRYKKDSLEDAKLVLAQSLICGWTSANDPSNPGAVECLYCGNRTTDKECDGGRIPCYCRADATDRS